MSVEKSTSSKLGSMAGTVKILGDIVAPVIDRNDMGVYRD